MSISPWFSGQLKDGEPEELVLSDLEDEVQVTLRQQEDGTSQKTIRFRVINVLEYEPQLGAFEDRISDIIQIKPRDGVFNPPAQIRITLPAFASSSRIGQLVCIYCRTFGSRGGSPPKWKPLCSDDFALNEDRTEAVILCRKSGLYTVKRTDFPEVTKRIFPHESCTLSLKEEPGIEATFPAGCVTKPLCVSLKVLYTDRIFSEPGGRTPRKKSRRDGEFIETVASPVVVLLPTKRRIIKPAILNLPICGSEFRDVFSAVSARITAVHGHYNEREGVKWNYVFSIPEMRDNKETGDPWGHFLITKFGFYKLVRRIPSMHLNSIDYIDKRLNQKMTSLLRRSTNHVPVQVLVHMSDIEEPGKQFRLQITCQDSPINTLPSDDVFRHEVARSHLSVPLGRVRFVVRGKFEPDRDAPDRSPDRTVIFTGKKFSVVYGLRLMLSDMSKLPDIFGHVSVHGKDKVQYVMDLKKSDMIGRSRLSFALVTNTPSKSHSRGTVTARGDEDDSVRRGSQLTATWSPQASGKTSSRSILPQLHSTDSSVISSPQRAGVQSVTLPVIRIT